MRRPRDPDERDERDERSERWRETHELEPYTLEYEDERNEIDDA